MSQNKTVPPGSVFALTFLICFIYISAFPTESWGQQKGHIHCSSSTNFWNWVDSFFKNKTPIENLLIKTTHFPIKYIKTKWETKYFPANCVKRKEKNKKKKKRSLAYICLFHLKTGPLPQTLWMSDRSLVAAKVPCIYFFSVYVCIYNFPFYSLTNMNKDPYSSIYQRKFC